MAASLSGLQYWLQPYAAALVRLRPGVVVTSTYRSYSEQLALWLSRSSNPFPVAPPGRSMHQAGRAFDLSGSDEDLAYLARVWQHWGGRWFSSDPIHFEA